MKLVDDVKQFVSVLRKMLRRKESKRVEFGSTEAEGNLEHLGGRLEPRQRPQLCLQTLWYAYAMPMLCKSKREEFGSTPAEGIREHPSGRNSGAFLF